MSGKSADASAGATGDAPWARRSGDRWLLDVHVQPGATRSEVVGLHGERLKIRVAAPAVDGRANAVLVAFLAKVLDVARADIEVVRGAKGRGKTLAVPATTDLGPLTLG